ncbi:NADP-dependent oxidoreductase [Microbacterium sp. ARD32]|uniref:NADP-dependent oxidoreductase n=1 Tax=Microbacterium sp. ARD32 TaxID=2962577 RepID=UPI0028829328|nr:NADP-dependent oxidoreductase [Microbacterium sp. ARD32]MDT0156602.1 NADP-dependent oxidoreductase [Microbacterium sp. ARD32]
MQGIGIEHYGEQPRLIDIPLPDPATGEIEVELFAASRNPLDEAVAAGHLAGHGEFRFPLILGFDGAGVIRRTAGASAGFSAGDRVFGQFWAAAMQFGTFAEATVVQARPAFGALRRIPNGVSFEDAAAAPTAGMTAVGALDSSRAASGDTVLILGASGGVGAFAVQEAKARGIRVLAGVSPEAADALRALGADDVLPRDADLPEALAALGAAELAAVLDFTGATDAVDVAAESVRGGGTVVSTAYGVSDALRAQNRIVAVEYVLDEKPARLERLADALSAGAVRPVVSREIGLEDALHRPAPPRDGLRGKTVIRLR